MLNRQDYIQQISDALALLSRKVEINTSLNLTDINIHSEYFYRDLLNLALGYNLVNINTINPSAAAIDLGDPDEQVAIQVTSTSDLKKTRTTVEKFIEKELYNDYDRLIILNLVNVTRHKDPLIGDEDVYQLDTKNDMWDYKDLARFVADKDLDALKDIGSFLNKELNISSDQKLPKEVNTIVSLIDHLSNCENPDSGRGFIEDPDPNGKIYKRFAEYSDFLTKSYQELYQIYGPNLETAKDVTDIGTVQVAKKSLYLKSHSDHVLNQCEGDPKAALDRLTDEYASVLSQKGIDYDRTAITFFLVDELTRCNVFPNLDSVNG